MPKPNWFAISWLSPRASAMEALRAYGLRVLDTDAEPDVLWEKVMTANKHRYGVMYGPNAYTIDIYGSLEVLCA